MRMVIIFMMGPPFSPWTDDWACSFFCALFYLFDFIFVWTNNDFRIAALLLKNNHYPRAWCSRSNPTRPKGSFLVGGKVATLNELLTDQHDAMMKLLETGGELSSELESKIGELSEAVPAKVDGYFLFLERLEADSEYFKRRADELKLAQKSLEKAHERIRDHIKFLMINQEKDSLSGNDYHFQLANGKPSVVITNEDLIPEEYVNEIVTRVVDKNRVAQDLAFGVPIPGAHLQQNKSLRSSVNKSTKRIKGDKK